MIVEVSFCKGCVFGFFILCEFRLRKFFWDVRGEGRVYREKIAGKRF